MLRLETIPPDALVLLRKNDAEHEVMPKMLMPVEWESAKAIIRQAVKELA